jgi:DNA-directed RNA polymerase subunit alpha
MLEGLTREQQALLDEPVQVLGLDVRTTNALENPSHPPVVRTIRDLLLSRPEELLGIPNIGDKTVSKIYRALEKLGFYRPSREYIRSVKEELERKRTQERRFMIGF